MFIVSVDHMLHDYEKMLRFDNMKRVKRISRYNLICRLVGKESRLDEIVMENHEFVGDEFKMFVKGFLTNCLHHRSNLYSRSMEIVERLNELLSEDYILSKYFDSRQILVIIKGGQAQKNVLKRLYPMNTSEIEKEFGLDGDNDISILIDPSIEEYNEIHKRVMDLSFNFLQEVRHNLDDINDFIDDLFKDSVVKPYPRRDLLIFDDDCNEVGMKHPIFVSKAERWQFGTAEFALIRLMKSYLYQGRKVSSELLDISIPYRNDSASKEFDLYLQQYTLPFYY